jgi:hypothetical protein
MLSVKEKTGKNAQAWDEMLNFAKKIKFIIYSLVIMLFFHFTLNYKVTWHCNLFLNLKMCIFYCEGWRGAGTNSWRQRELWSMF